MMAPVMTKYELARVLGMRALQLSEGSAIPHVSVSKEHHENVLYTAALELHMGMLDARVRRGEETLDIREMRLPRELLVMLDTVDGGRRSYRGTSTG